MINSTRHLIVLSNVNCTVYYITLNDTHEIGNGEKIYNQGNILLSDVILSNNYEGNIHKLILNECDLQIENSVELND